MKGFSFNFFNIFAVSTIILLLIVILVPFRLINMEQAERIAKWKIVYEELRYSFGLVKLHEGHIVPKMEELDKPFVTIEYSLKTKKVLQCYAYKNTKPDEKVLKFVHEKWLPYANKQLQKIAA